MAKRTRRESASSSSVPQLLRCAIEFYEKKRGKVKAKPAEAREAADTQLYFRESKALRPIEAVKPPAAGECPRIKVLLIDEGLGNRRNMNYYSPEAIESAVKVFEGKPSFINHPSESEETDLPERSVAKQFGFYKGLHVETIEGKKACVGELHFELTEAGREMYGKALTAIEYQRQFPDSGSQYIGFSVLGGGIGGKKTMKVEGEDLEVNYVTEFVEGESCDAVTRAGRGGRVLAVVEDANGHKEGGMKKQLLAALAKVQESAKKATGEVRKALEAELKNLKALVEAAEDPAKEESGDHMAAFKAHVAKKDEESDDEHMARLHGYAKHLAGHLKPKEEDGADGDGADDSDDDSADSAHHKPSAEESERNIRAVKSYLVESGLPEGALTDEKIKRLAKLPWREAKAQIDDVATLAESLSAANEEPVAHLRGGSRTTRETAGGSRTKAFAGSFKEAR